MCLCVCIEFSIESVRRVFDLSEQGAKPPATTFTDSWSTVSINHPIGGLKGEPKTHVD